MPLITNKTFSDWIKGKTVALVGPAASAEKFNNGQLIDSYDVVCRIKSIYVPEDKVSTYGSRIDVLYTDNNQTNDVLPGDLITDRGDKRTIIMNPKNVELRADILANQIKFVVSTYPQSEWFFHRFVHPLQEMARLTNVRILPDEPYMSVRKQTNRPTAGLSAIIDLTSLPVKELFITGIDFYRSMYRENYLNSLYTVNTVSRWGGDAHEVSPSGFIDRHDPDAQFMWFKNNLWQKDDRLTLDPFMTEIMSDPRYESFAKAAEIMESQ